jgi:hypothetical protein
VRFAARISLLAAGLLCGWVASAGGAGLPPLPTTIQVPTLPLLPAPQPPPVQVPVPPVPEPVPVPVPQLPIAAPKAPAVPPVAQQPSQSLSIAQSGATNSSEAGSGTPTSAPRPSQARPVRVLRLRLSRDWIARAGPRKHRKVVLVFSLTRAALVEFVVLQVSPVCRRVGRFRVQGRAGRNQVAFGGRIGGRALPPGTYRIQARAGRKRVVDTQFVVLSRRESDEIASAHGADACRAASVVAARPSSSGTAGPRAEPKPAGVSGQGLSGSHPSEGVLGTSFAQEAVDAVKSIPPWLYALLGLAIVLLAVAALPLRATPGPRTAVLLANRRAPIALAGAAVLTVATIAYALN